MLSMMRKTPNTLNIFSRENENEQNHKKAKQLDIFSFELVSIILEDFIMS